MRIRPLHTTSKDIALDITTEVARISENGTLVLVEGKRDRQSLQRLGLINIQSLDGPLFEVVERIARDHRDVVLLVDLDAEGRKLYRRLAHDLAAHGVRVDDALRNLLFQTPLRHIEGLATFLGNMERKRKTFG